MNDMENHLLSSINSLKDEILNLKDIVIKYLQNDNENPPQKCEWLESRCAKYGADHNALVQYGRRNNVVLSSIPDSISDDTLEESVTSFLADIDVFVEHQGKAKTNVAKLTDRNQKRQLCDSQTSKKLQKQKKR